VIRASIAHRASPAAVARRAASLRERGFTMGEAELFGLLDPAVRPSELAGFSSRREAYAVQDRLNPESFRALAEDKALFARFCSWRGVPTPRLVALYVRDGPGWTPEGGFPWGREEWLRLLREGLPEEFVVKPAWGHLGKGVRVLRRDRDAFAEVEGGRLDADGLLAIMGDDPDWPAWIVQERVRNHPDLRRLSGTDALQTVRAITLVDRGGTARVIWAELRVVIGDAQVDNWRDGTTGNGLAPVDLTTGRLRAVFAPDPRKRSVCSYAAHPRTGIRFDEVVLPDWPSALALLERVALEVTPLRAVGWDLVLSPGGPLMLEMQARWGPHNPSRAMPLIMATLEAELAH